MIGWWRWTFGWDTCRSYISRVDGSTWCPTSNPKIDRIDWWPFYGLFHPPTYLFHQTLTVITLEGGTAWGKSLGLSLSASQCQSMDAGFDGFKILGQWKSIDLGKLCLVLLSNLVQMAELFRAAGKWKTLVQKFLHQFLMIFVGDIGPCLFHHGVFFFPLYSI